MPSMFQDNFNQDISTWDVSNVIEWKRCFKMLLLTKILIGISIMFYIGFSNGTPLENTPNFTNCDPN